MITYIIPTFLTIVIASRIQNNFKKEINLLKKRRIEENLEYTHSMKQYKNEYNNNNYKNNKNECDFGINKNIILNSLIKLIV